MVQGFYPIPTKIISCKNPVVPSDIIIRILLQCILANDKNRKNIMWRPWRDLSIFFTHKDWSNSSHFMRWNISTVYKFVNPYIMYRAIIPFYIQQIMLRQHCVRISSRSEVIVSRSQIDTDCIITIVCNFVSIIKYKVTTN